MSKNPLRQFGLIGYPLTHSFSQQFFSKKFKTEKLLHCRYSLFPLQTIGELGNLLKTQPALEGLNVTIPHKQSVIPFLHYIDPKAQAIGAVNVIKIKNGELSGYNTDADGFATSLNTFLQTSNGPAEGLKALVLGTGGASKAITFALSKLGIPFQLVSRAKAPGILTYQELTSAFMAEHRLLINTTPLGTFPNIDERPPLPYSLIGPEHLFFDLVYNPEKTLFLATAEKLGCPFRNGLEMLHLQAELAWKIWNQ